MSVKYGNTILPWVIAVIPEGISRQSVADAVYTRNAEWLSKLRMRLSEVLMKMKRGELQEAKID